MRARPLQSHRPKVYVTPCRLPPIIIIDYIASGCLALRVWLVDSEAQRTLRHERFATIVVCKLSMMCGGVHAG